MFLGIDIGTSGVRAILIDASGAIVAEGRSIAPHPRTDGPAVRQDAEAWWRTTCEALGRLPLGDVKAVCVDGTSGTVLLVDEAGRPRTPGFMYNDSSAAAEAAEVKGVATAETGAIGATSGLAKGVKLWRESGSDGLRLVHQADWIRARLDGRFDVTDENNALKTGYDPVARRWPDWIGRLGLPSSALQEVRPVGARVGRTETADAAALGLPREAMTVAGTTDGCASFLATGASEIGDATTALGTTLTVKLLSDEPVFDAASGVYSHRMGERWLVGGASNSGGAALAIHFSPQEIERLSILIDPETASGLDYYPLPRPGERFPINDPDLEPRVSPRPQEDWEFLKGLLEGVAEIERMAYEKLGRPRRVLTVGGGARNAVWTRIRSRVLGLPVSQAEQVEAAYGVALVARKGAMNAS